MNLIPPPKEPRAFSTKKHISNSFNFMIFDGATYFSMLYAPLKGWLFIIVYSTKRCLKNQRTINPKIVFVFFSLGPQSFNDFLMKKMVDRSQNCIVLQCCTPWMFVLHKVGIGEKLN